ncbi:hypothetical protein ALC60_10488 [Trachymyrmex zeteki]|uniref:Uncharacterized protein n=1 Tax=Mycetomoellerius zeteki TaxID=64791 RepID=A0A151WRE3_9HYME|nr:hypothetical protein ALC60_10488 [Trachymyrmex zeteki]
MSVYPRALARDIAGRARLDIASRWGQERRGYVHAVCRPSLRQGPLVSVAPLCAIMAVYRPDPLASGVTAAEPRGRELFYDSSTTRTLRRIVFLSHFLLTGKDSASPRSQLSMFSLDPSMDVFGRYRRELYRSVMSTETYLILYLWIEGVTLSDILPIVKSPAVEMIFFLK